MKLKAQQVFDATLVVAQIIRDNRPMPTKASYRLARLHMKLLPEFQTLSTRRDEMITVYGHHETTGGQDGVPVTVSDQFSVPIEKMSEFNAAWAEIGNEEIEVDVEPVHLGCLDMGGSLPGSISAAEFVAFGPLVTED